MKSKLNSTTQSRLKAVCDEILHHHNLTAQDLLAEVQSVMNELGGEAEAAAQRADDILAMIRDRQSKDSKKLQKFLEKLERNATRH